MERHAFPVITVNLPEWPRWPPILVVKERRPSQGDKKIEGEREEEKIIHVMSYRSLTLDPGSVKKPFDRNTALFSAAFAPHPASEWTVRVRREEAGFRCKPPQRDSTGQLCAHCVFAFASSLARNHSSYRVSDNMMSEKALLNHVAVTLARPRARQTIRGSAGTRACTRASSYRPAQWVKSAGSAPRPLRCTCRQTQAHVHPPIHTHTHTCAHCTFLDRGSLGGNANGQDLSQYRLVSRS